MFLGLQYSYPGLKTLSRGNFPTLGSIKLKQLVLSDKCLAIKCQMSIWFQTNTSLSMLIFRYK